MATRRRRRNMQVPRPPNMRDFGESMSFPGIDPRTWASYGIVDAQSPVDFDDDYGPLVAVALQPSDVPAYCRVASSIAGDGESEYHPFVGGDEVLVILPHGRPDADPVIIGRLNNSRQKWPSSVGGQDATKNTFGFRRARTPRVDEYANAILMRQAPSGAMLSIDTNGIVTIRDGAGSAFQISPDVIGFQDSSAKHVFQIDLSGDRAMLQVADSRLIVAGSKASPAGSSLTVGGLFSVMTLSNPASEHVVTTEALANILAQWGIAISAAAAASYTPAITAVLTPAAGAPLTPIAAPFAAAIAAAFASGGATLSAALAAAAQSPLLPPLASAIFGAFSAAQQKPPAAPGQGQLLPGIGCAGFLVG